MPCPDPEALVVAVVQATTISGRPRLRLCETDSMLNHTWLDQWERVHRRLNDVRAVYRGAPRGTPAAVDAVQSFFESVHHLKDWLGNDPSVPLTKADGDALINSSNDLKLCADLANGSKHFKFTSTRTGDLSTDIKRNDVTVFVGTGTSAHRFYIQSRGDHDVLNVAEAAVAAWASYLSRKGLIPAPTP